MIRFFLMTGLLLAAGPAWAGDWYETSPDGTQCLDMAVTASTGGNPQLATPQGTQALYQSAGEVVTSAQVNDAAGAPIIVMHIKDNSGNPILDFTFFPSLADCQFVLAQSKGH